MEFEKKVVIAVSGFARSGKSSLCSLLSEDIGSRFEKKTKVFSFARQLKADVYDFCIDKIGISSFTEIPNEKERIRPLLIWYGNLQREISSGMHWIKKLKSEINTFFLQGGEVALISDLRFKEFNYDEIDFVRSYKNNIIVNVEKNGITEAVANFSERKNIPIIKPLSDFNVNWGGSVENSNLKNSSQEIRNKIVELALGGLK